MSSTPRNLLSIAAVAVLGLLAGCGSSQAKEKEQMSVALNSGRYQTAYDKAKEVLANPEAHDEATVDYARQVLKDSRTILSDHYSGNISVHIATGNYDRALGVWSDVTARVPELVETNTELKLKLMRVYAARQLWDQAKEMAEAVRSRTSVAAERDEAEEFINSLDEFRRQESELADLARRVADLESKTGMDLSGGATCGAASNEALSEEDRRLMIDLEKARGELDSVRAKLTKRPAIDQGTPDEQAEASGTQS